MSTPSFRMSYLDKIHTDSYNFLIQLGRMQWQVGWWFQQCALQRRADSTEAISITSTDVLKHAAAVLKKSKIRFKQEIVSVVI